jgi:SAM-dependent methyltransferase
VPLLFAVALFVSAFLLFLVQPMVGKMLLPLMGGTPAVWNTCMVFFQAALLAGYAYSHLTTAKLGVKRQAILHLAILAIPAVVLPIAISGETIRTAAATEYPGFLLLKILAVGVGLPFFAVATTGPLLQKWFADTGHPAARDPYFLYAASNLGSLLALAAYPLLVEPARRLTAQSGDWAIGYGIFVLLVVVCAVQLWRPQQPAPMAEDANAEPPAPPPTWPRRARWVFLAFVPSSLLLGVTTHLSTDIAPIPLLWVVPLAIYLITFILVFSRRPLIPHRWMSRVLPIAVLMPALTLLINATSVRWIPVWTLLVPPLFALFAAGMVAHGELARDRPAPQYLTEFYLWLSAGGVLGGLFNALLAPVLFHRLGLIEYPIALVLACMIRARPTADAKADSRGFVPAVDVLPAVGIGLLTIVLVLVTTALNMESGAVRNGVTFGLPCVLAYLLVDRPVRYGLGIAALMLVGALNLDLNLLHLERNFFGVLKVIKFTNPEGATFRALYHGSTVHGQQRLDRPGRHEPLTYYHPAGPVGKLFDKWTATHRAPLRVAAVGLGTGSLAYYARPTDAWDFYEIDPAVERIARNPEYFNFLSECMTDRLRVVLGDARLRLADADGRYDVIVLDAFSSDAIPTHLLTREALELYERKLAPGGVLAFHISNRYLDLGPIIARGARSLSPPLVVISWDDVTGDVASGRLPSTWLVLARTWSDLAPLGLPTGWAVQPRPDTPLWTDDFSNLLRAWKTDD